MENRWSRSLVFETCSGPWIVRPTEHRICRPGRAVDPLFVPAEHWETVDRFESTGRQLRARLASGKWVSAVLAPTRHECASPGA